MYVWELPATNWEGIGVWSMEGTVFFRTPLQSPSKMGAKEPQEFSFCYLPPVNFSFKTSWNCRKYSEWPFWNTSPHFKYLHPSSILLYLICLIHVSFGATRWSGEVGCLLNSAIAVVDRLLQRLLLSKEQCPVDISKTGITLINNVVGLLPIGLAIYLKGPCATNPTVTCQVWNYETCDYIMEVCEWFQAVCFRID